MKLQEILQGIDCEEVLQNPDISDIAYDSRKASSGKIFVAIPGEAVDGHKFADSAYQNGCRVFAVERLLPLPDDAIQIKVKSSRKALSRMSANLFGNPSKRLRVIGITGTKGKSTIIYLMQGVLREAGISCGIIGTNGIEFLNRKIKTVNTTPESYELHKAFAEMLECGVDTVVMEVSSQGIKMNRVDDVAFDCGVFTNLSPDHIGPSEHKDMEEYISCKAKLFTMCKNSVINADDEVRDRMINSAIGEVITFSTEKTADLFADHQLLWQSSNMLGVSFDLHDKDEITQIKLCLPGKFSVYNGLAVIGVAKAMGIELDFVKSALNKTTVPGRAELLPLLPDVKIVIDYAHNRLSMENIMQAMKAYQPNRIICLFGSVGGRTQIRRKQLGEVASLYADLCILTADNPDFEDPADIARDIHDGFARECEYLIIPDRKEAIEYAVKIAQSGDMILLCGKGHEDYQIIKGKRVPFSEKEILKEAVSSYKK